MSKIIRLAIPLSILFLLPALLLSQSRTGPQIKWMTWTEAMEKMATDAKPKKIMVDLYTDWCGYCKKMDRTTFQDKEVIKYVNEHFIPIKLDAEQKEIIKNKSLTLLNVNALKLQPRVVILYFQKLISKKDVKPINSQPSINVKKLLPLTNIIIESINQFINKINSSSLSSLLK